ncbi:hypothetical protein IWW40_005129 [Coemansia sp. RSA 1250]|nr:hypothetical protein IWW40_005129 [Coemansia sp. RSA 1250]
MDDSDGNLDRGKRKVSLNSLFPQAKETEDIKGAGIPAENAAKWGRPKGSTKTLQPTDTDTASTSKIPAKRGRPKGSTRNKQTTENNPAVETNDGLPMHTTDTSNTPPKKRGRPRKLQATESEATNVASRDGGSEIAEPLATPKKRGRPRKTSLAKTPLSLPLTQTEGTQSSDIMAETMPTTPKKRPQPKRSGKIQTQLTSQSFQMSRKATTSKQKSAKRDIDDDDDEFVAGSSEEDEAFIPEADAEAEIKPKTPKYKRKYNMSKKTGKKDSYWSGPSTDQRQINPAYIDYGLDESVWSELQNIRIKPQLMAVETAADTVLKHLPQLEGLSSDTMTLVMHSDKEPSDTDPELQLKPLNVHELPEDRAGFMANVCEYIPAIDWRPDLSGSSSECVDYIATGSLGPKSAGSASLAIGLSKRVKDPAPGSILVWRLITSQRQQAQCQLDMALLHTFGHCLSVKWCPLSMATSAPESSEWPVIGILAAIFGDGHLRAFAVPDPDVVRKDHRSALAMPGVNSTCQPAFLHWLSENSLADIKAPHGTFTSLAWVSSDVIVAGTSRGNLMAWDIKSAIQTQFSNSQAISKDSWPYSTSGLVSQQTPPNVTRQPIPFVNHMLHNGDVHDISIFCSGSALDAKFGTYRSASGFLPVEISDLQVLTVGMDGRHRQIVLLNPVRQNATVEFPSRRSSLGLCYWIYGTCVYSEADKALRMHHERIMSASYDPWIRSTAKAGRFVDFREEAVKPSSAGYGVPEDSPVTWNLSQDRPSMYVNKLGCPTLAISASDMHPYVAIAKSDGELVIANFNIAWTKRSLVPHSRAIYTLQCYSNMDTPQPDAEDGDNDDVKYAYKSRSCIEKRPGGGHKLTSHYNLYMPQVSVLACAWSRNPDTFSWIASSNANGVLRIEDVAP